MSAVTLFIIVGLICALVELFQAQGRSIGWWGVVFLCIGLLWGRLG